MFQNNNSAIVKQLAKKSLQADSRRNGFVIVTIAVAACLMATISLITMESKQKKINDVSGMYQASFLNVSQNTIKDLKRDPALDGAGEYYLISEKKMKDYSINCIYMDEDVFRLSKMTWEGTLPGGPDDVMLERAYLSKIGKKADIGDKITLDLGDGRKEYYITGFIQYGAKSANAKIFSIIRSKDSLSTDDVAKNAVCIRLSNSDDMSAGSLKNAVFKIAGHHGIARKNVDMGNSYFYAIEPISTGNLLAIIGVAVMVGLASALVIYSIFYISVTGKVREYGQLRTIGTTKKQIKKMVFREGVHLSAVGIPTGLIAACLLAFAVVPKGWNTVSTLEICLAVAVFTFIIVSLAIRRPMKIASATPSVEAMRYSAASEAIKTVKTTKLHRKLSPFHLAAINFTRNRKKSLLTLLSLGFSGILLMCAASYNSSLSIEAITRGDLFNYGDFQLSLAINNSDNADGYAMSRIQQNNPLNEAMKQKILAIDGVTGIQVEKSAKVRYTLPDGAGEGNYVSGFSESDVAAIQSRLKSGTVDYRHCMEQNGIIVMAAGVFKEIYGTAPAVGDKIALEFYTAGGIVQKECTVLGVMDARIKDGSFLMPVEALQDVTGINTNMQFSIAADPEKKANVETELRAIFASDPSFDLTVLDDLIAEKENEFQTMSFILYSIVLVTVFFGIINLINTIVTNVLSRRQELGVLQAIGLSSRQLNQMLQSEGMFYTLGTVAVTLTVGTGLGWFLCESIRRFSDVSYIDYHFPLIPVLLFLAVFLLIQISISFVSSNMVQKQSLVERIRGV